MRVFGNLVAATLKDMARDKMTIFWFILFPVLFMFLFGMIFSREDTVNFNLGVVVEKPDGFSQMFLANLEQVDMLTLHYGTLDDELDALGRQKRNAVLVLPPVQFGSNEEITIPVYYDAANQANRVLVVMLSEIFTNVERVMQNRARLFVVDAKPVQAEGLRDVDYILPGIMSMALMQLGLFGSIRLVYLREKRVLRSLGATPLPRAHIVFSEIIIRLLMAALQTSLILLIGHFVFNVKILGSWWQVLGTVFFGAAVFVSIGYMLVTFAKTEESGHGIIQVVQFPMMFLSGIFFPMDFIPAFLKPVVRAIPLTYLGDLLRAVTIGSPYAFGLATDLLVLSGWLIVSLVLAIRFWRWE